MIPAYAMLRSVRHAAALQTLVNVIWEASEEKATGIGTGRYRYEEWLAYPSPRSARV